MNKKIRITNKISDETKKVFNNRLIVSIFLFFYWVVFVILVWISNINSSYVNSDFESFPWLEGKYKGIIAYIANIYLLPIVICIAYELNKLCFEKEDLSTIRKKKYFSFIFLSFIGSILLIVPNTTHITISYYYFLQLPNFLKLKETSIYLIVLVITIAIAIILMAILIKITHLNDFKKIVSLIVLSSISFFGVFSLSFISIIKTWILIIYIVVIISFTDVFAYLAGIIFGKTKMSKNISPKKTWEGFSIGLFITILLSLLLTFLFSLGGKDFKNELTHISLSKYGDWVYYLFMIFVIMFLSICSTVGDLFYSYFKRVNNIKDYGTFLKSHGGILDRFDSLLFTSSAYTILLFILIGISDEKKIIGEYMLSI